MPVAKIIALLIFTIFHTLVSTLVLSIKLVGTAQLIITKQPIKSAVWVISLSFIHYLDGLNVFM